LLRHATDPETHQLTRQFGLLPMLSSPADLWIRAAQLGRACRNKGVTAGSIDLLITAIAINHGAELITFDDDFRLIASASPLKVKVLKRPSP
jgi:predicted nucleic acid-binding protein